MRSAAIDSAARAQAVASLRSVLVQAPAGSGKTTLLAQRYLRLLATVDAPERILALTFTRRAAQEMRERVLQALKAAHLPECPPGWNALTWQLAGSAKRRMDELRLDIERHPSRLRIETIDAFNGWLAGQLPISAGTGSRLHLLEDPKPLYREAARRALAHADDPFAGAVDHVLALDDQRWGRLLKLIADMLPSRDRWLPLLAGGLQVPSALDGEQLLGVRQRFDEDLALLVSRAIGRAYDAVGGERIAALSRLLPAAAQRLGEQRSDLSEWLNATEELQANTSDIARWRGITDVLLTGEGSFRKKLTKNEGFPPQCADKTIMLDLLAELERDPAVLPALREIRTLPTPAYGDEQWERVRNVAQVLVLAAAQLQQVFREQGAVDFPAVSMAALRALGTEEAPTDLSLRLDYRLQHILVDEFQDTSSAQLQLLRLLTAGWQSGDGRSVFCVGDPMQSIYGFRDAEVRAFLELAEDGIGDLRFEVQRLSSNFRSAKPLVDWINACFSRILPRIDDRDRGAIAFRPSESALQQPMIGGTGVDLSGHATRAAESLAIADSIAAQVALHPEWRIAVLVRAKAHAREIAASLRSRGVAFRAVAIEPLQDRSVVRDLVMLLCALLHLGDRTAWLAVLRAPWAGIVLADLLTIARAAPVVWDALADDAVLARLSEDGRERCRRLRSVFEAAFAVRSHTSIARWVERTWLNLGGPSCAGAVEDLAHARAAFAHLGELERLGLPDAADLVQSFAELHADHGTMNAVEIMTIHKAKGLEFDMVVLPALDRYVPRNRDQLLLPYQFARTGRDGMVMAARTAVGAETDRLFEFLRRQSRDASGLEAQRLLYVACTRAKWRLQLTATIGRREEPDAESVPSAGEPWSPRAGSLLAVLWPIAGHEFRIASSDKSGAGEAAPRGGPLRRVPSDWAPRLHDLTPATPVVPATPLAQREDWPVFDWAGETARRVGSLVHAELQVLDLQHSDEAAIRAREPHFKRWLALQGVPAERLQDAVIRVISALLAVRRDPRGRWVLQKGYRDDFREYAVSGKWHGEVVRVVFDRSFIDSDGVRWVIDYKTSQHKGSELEEFLDREVERYRPQMQRYAMLAQLLGPEPVHAGLYFPLMSAWREISLK
jgi:ATP-dependent exoDNAse (exonuclease V) beta subunit